MTSEFDPNQEPAELNFEAFQADLEKQEIEQLTAQEYQRVRTVKIEAAFEKFEVQHMVNGSCEVLRDGFEDYYAAMSEVMREVYAEQGIFPDSDEIEVKAKSLAKERAVEEMHLMTKVNMMMITADGLPPDQATGHKYEIIADWITKHEYSIDSPWAKFLNEVLPGDEFTEERGVPYLIESMEKVLNQHVRDQKYQELVTSAAEQIGLPVNEVTLAGIIRLFALSKLRDMRSEADADAAIDEIARDMQIDASKARAIVDYLNENS